MDREFVAVKRRCRFLPSARCHDPCRMASVLHPERMSVVASGSGV